MSAIAIVTQRLLGSPDITAVVGDKVFPILAPQTAARPYVIIHLIDNADEPMLAGASRYYRSIVQVDTYTPATSAGARQVLELGDAVIETLNGIVKDRISGATDVDVLLGSADHTEHDIDAATFRRTTQFSVRWRRPLGGPADDGDVADPSSITFSFTAGTGNDAVGYVGEDHFSGWGPFGSLVAEPITGHPLQACTSQASTGSVVAFTGDVSALLAGKSVWVDGVDYGPGVQYAWDAAAGVTIWNRITGGPVFVDGQSYNVEIK